MALRDALEALLDGSYGVDHYREFGNLVGRRGDDADLLQDFQIWLLSRPDIVRKDLSANDSDLPRYVRRSLNRFAFDRERPTPRGQLRDALSTAIREEARIDENNGLLMLVNAEPTLDWPSSLWAGKTGQFDHQALREAAMSALAEARCALDRTELTGALVVHYGVGICPEASDDQDGVEEELRRRRDGQTLAGQILQLLTPEDRVLLAASLSRKSAAGAPNRRVEQVHAKLKAWVNEEPEWRTSRTFGKAIEALRNHFGDVGRGR